MIDTFLIENETPDGRDNVLEVTGLPLEAAQQLANLTGAFVSDQTFQIDCSNIEESDRLLVSGVIGGFWQIENVDRIVIFAGEDIYG